MGRRSMLMTTQEKVAAGLSGEDVKVTFDYHRPVVNVLTKNIRVPPPPEEVDEETEINMRSWIDHESGHIRFSTEGWERDLVKDKVMKNLCFALEDCRVDRKNGEKFPGTRDNRRRGYDVVRPQMRVKNVLQAAYRVLYEQVKEYYNLESSIVYWTQRLEEPMALFGLADLMDSVSDLIVKLRKVETQKQVIAISREIKDRWKKLFKSGGQGDSDSDQENKMSDGGQFNQKKDPKKNKQDKKSKKMPSSGGDSQESDDDDDDSDDSSGGSGKNDKKSKKPSDDDDEDGDGGDDDEQKTGSDSDDNSEDSDNDAGDDDEDGNDDSDADRNGKKSDDEADDGDSSDSDDDDEEADGKSGSEDSDDEDESGSGAAGDEDDDDSDEDGEKDSRADQDDDDDETGAGGKSDNEVDEDMDDMMDDFKSTSDAEQDELENRFANSNDSKAANNRRFGGNCPPGYRSFTGEDSVIDLEPKTSGLTKYDERGRPVLDKNRMTISMSPEEFRSEIRAKLGTFQRRLMRALMARRRLWIKDREDGALDDSRLHRVPTGDKRVFKRRLSRPSLNIAVSVLLDMSGSMMGYAQYLCAQLGYVLAETCSLIRVPFESLGFTTGSSYGISRSRYQRSYRGIGDSQRVSGVYYHRDNPLKLIVIKPFEMTRRGDMLSKFYGAAAWCGGGTTEGEAIWWAARRLAQQRRQRRLLITICDGAPNGSPAPNWKFEEHVSTTIDRLRRAGIETMHVGIGTDAPKRYVPEETFVRYNGIDSLITEFAPAFGAILLNERTRNTPPIPIH